MPTDPYSLHQAYQRWLYQDYAHLWTLQTPATRQEYATAGSRHHLTGFQYWLRVMLATKPGLLAWWKLDITHGGIAYDSSPFNFDGIITGATPTTLAIDGALYFDGINDHVDIFAPIHLYNFTQRSFVCYFNAPAFTGTERTITWFNYQAPLWGERIILLAGSNNISAGLWNNAGVGGAISIPFTPDTLHCFIYTWDGATFETYLDGVPSGAPVAIAGTVSCAGDLIIGARRVWDRWYKGYLDNVIYLNRVLNQVEIDRWTARRYPA